MTGTIALYKTTGEIIQSLNYTSCVQRKTIMENWKQLYGPGYNNCFIQIEPETYSMAINKDGTNSRKKKSGDGENYLIKRA